MTRFGSAHIKCEVFVPDAEESVGRTPWSVIAEDSASGSFDSSSVARFLGVAQDDSGLDCSFSL